MHGTHCDVITVEKCHNCHLLVPASMAPSLKLRTSRCTQTQVTIFVVLPKSNTVKQLHTYKVPDYHLEHKCYNQGGDLYVEYTTESLRKKEIQHQMFGNTRLRIFANVSFVFA